jgi:hypothetical protein
MAAAGTKPGGKTGMEDMAGIIEGI